MEFMTEIKLGGDIKALLLITVQGNANEDRPHRNSDILMKMYGEFLAYKPQMKRKWSHKNTAL